MSIRALVGDGLDLEPGRICAIPPDLAVRVAQLLNRTCCFQPSMPLIEKTRDGSKVRKKHDEARTPYRRVLESGAAPEQAKEELKRVYETLNPVKLGRQDQSAPGPTR